MANGGRDDIWNELKFLILLEAGYMTCNNSQIWTAVINLDITPQKIDIYLFIYLREEERGRGEGRGRERHS